MPKKIREKLSDVLAVPQAIMLDVPRIVFDSNTKIFIENYKGVSEFSDTSIKINAGRYIISLYGTNLDIKVMTAEEIEIEGMITKMEFS